MTTCRPFGLGLDHDMNRGGLGSAKSLGLGGLLMGCAFNAVHCSRHVTKAWLVSGVRGCFSCP